MSQTVPRRCPASGLRIGARFVARKSDNTYTTSCPTCEADVPVNIKRENQPWPMGPKFTRTIAEHDRQLYLGGF